MGGIVAFSTNWDDSLDHFRGLGCVLLLSRCLLDTLLERKRLRDCYLCSSKIWMVPVGFRVLLAAMDLLGGLLLFILVTPIVLADGCVVPVCGAGFCSLVAWFLVAAIEHRLGVGLFWFN
ncbi:unnamed protein product [Linum trigynum]|uniref:Transmembrane protein n=1 Tax=Linum trigynum TaxID=586398 RepID=A0AAV2E2J3_9ROSI